LDGGGGAATFFVGVEGDDGVAEEDEVAVGKGIVDAGLDGKAGFVADRGVAGDVDVGADTDVGVGLPVEGQVVGDGGDDRDAVAEEGLGADGDRQFEKFVAAVDDAGDFFLFVGAIAAGDAKGRANANIATIGGLGLGGAGGLQEQSGDGDGGRYGDGDGRFRGLPGIGDFHELFCSSSSTFT
jgi:hypothetical protein